MPSRNEGWVAEVIPDSEEERISQARKESSFTTSVQCDVIELSDDEDDEEGEFRKMTNEVSSTWVVNKHGGQSSGSDYGTVHSSSSPTKRTGRNYLRSRIIESSESEDTDNNKNPLSSVKRPTEIIELIDSSDEDRLYAKNMVTKDPTSFLKREIPTGSPVENKYSTDDDAIMVFDEPNSARRPARALDMSKVPTSSRNVFGGPSTPTRSSRDETKTDVVPKRKPVATPRSKVQKKIEEQRRLYSYATSLFQELNSTVFKNGLPEDTRLNWNKRLLTTAGRAKWHRSRDGIQTSEIELSEKILTSNERIRNTLSHEMCHLASWVIDGELKEGHGKFWKSWTCKVMRKYPEIDISTRHDYEISYPYTWKCEKCSKIYGRFSKSIKPDECVCGACREGKLIPQFQTNTRMQKTPKTSRMAAAKPQDSPCYTPTSKAGGGSSVTKGRDVDESDGDFDPPLSNGTPTCCVIYTVDSDSDIEVLTTILGGTTISAD